MSAILSAILIAWALVNVAFAALALLRARNRKDDR